MPNLTDVGQTTVAYVQSSAGNMRISRLSSHPNIESDTDRRLPGPVSYRFQDKLQFPFKTHFSIPWISRRRWGSNVALRFLPRDAMRKRGTCCWPVCLSVTFLYSKRLQISSEFFLGPVDPSFKFLAARWRLPIRAANAGAS